jgi:hypothetical protein
MPRIRNIEAKNKIYIQWNCDFTDGDSAFIPYLFDQVILTLNPNRIFIHWDGLYKLYYFYES